MTAVLPELRALPSDRLAEPPDEVERRGRLRDRYHFKAAAITRISSSVKRWSRETPAAVVER
jgi:hypothetical protein